jgi:hypothetical protein
VIGIGWNKIQDYQDDRYQAATAPSDFPEGMKSALAWFNEEDPHDARIGIVGGRGGFKQYVFYGNDLSNHVQYVGDEGSHGTFRPIASEAAQKGDATQEDAVKQCEAWRNALNEGDYDYVVISPDQRTQSEPPVEADWTGNGGAPLLEASDMVFVFQLNRELDPASCDEIDWNGPVGKTFDIVPIGKPRLKLKPVTPPQPQQ